MRCLSALLLPALLTVLLPAVAAAADSSGGHARPDNGLGLQRRSPDRERIELESGDQGLALVMPAEGGVYLTEEELGIDPADPMDYPLIWKDDGADLGFVVMTVGVLEYSTPIDALLFGELRREVEAGTYAQFPHKGVVGEKLEPAVEGGREWTLSTAGAPGGSLELTRFCTFAGNRFYGLFFFGGPGSSSDPEIRARMRQIVDSFEILQLAAERITVAAQSTTVSWSSRHRCDGMSPS